MKIHINQLSKKLRQENKKLKILFLAAEITPVAKVGGLGDVVGALPKNLAELNADLKIIIPFYNLIDKKKYRIKKINKKIIILTGNKKEIVGLWQTYLPQTKIPIYLIKHKYFKYKEVYLCDGKKMEDGKYADDKTDIKRFSFFTRAALEAVKAINFRPDIIHLHDWHVALAPAMIKNDYFFKNTKTIYTIHNLANQGIAKPQIVGFSKLNPNLPIIKADLKNGDINFMVQGILGADIITTVSPAYAKEILRHYQGAGLDNILRKRKKDLYGILNGIDTDFFNPTKDKLISRRYSTKNIKEKTKNKLILQKKLGLPQNKNTAVIGLVSRLVWQKGINLIIKKLAKLNCQFIFLGTGEKKYEEQLKKLAKKYPRQFSAQITFNEALAHQIYAGADIFLMPSLFEPCGLGQIIAMRYGTIPIVRKTGGLADTVTPSTGFVFKKFDSSSLYKTLQNILSTYYNQPKIWRQLQINGMKKDFSWKKSAKEYLRLYKKLWGS